MKESAMLDALIALAQTLGIEVYTVNLQKHSYGVRSGMCVVDDQRRIYLDRALHLSDRIDVMVDVLKSLAPDLNGVDPAVARLFDKRQAGGEAGQLALPVEQAGG